MGISSPWCDACVRVAAAREREGEAVGGGGGGTRGRDREEGDSGLGLWHGRAFGQVDCGEEGWAGLGCLSPLSLSHTFFYRKELERRKERDG